MARTVTFRAYPHGKSVSFKAKDAGRGKKSKKAKKVKRARRTVRRAKRAPKVRIRRKAKANKRGQLGLF